MEIIWCFFFQHGSSCSLDVIGYYTTNTGHSNTRVQLGRTGECIGEVGRSPVVARLHDAVEHRERAVDGRLWPAGAAQPPRPPALPHPHPRNPLPPPPPALLSLGAASVRYITNHWRVTNYETLWYRLACTVLLLKYFYNLATITENRWPR